jgi:hypothetical protein
MAFANGRFSNPISLVDPKYLFYAKYFCQSGMEKRFEFDAEIKGDDPRWPKAACVKIPFDMQEAYGSKGMVRVKATFDGIEYRGSIANMGNGPILVLVNEVREKIKKQVGDTVRVTVQKDTEERVIEIPIEFSALLNSNPEAQIFFESLSYTNRKEYARWITSAKKQETKDRRLLKSLDMLLSGVKTPG